MTWSHQSQAR